MKASSEGLKPGAISHEEKSSFIGLMPTFARRTITAYCILFIVFFISCHQKKPENLMDEELSKVYDNKFFNFKLKFPFSWCVQGYDANKEINNRRLIASDSITEAYLIAINKKCEKDSSSPIPSLTVMVNKIPGKRGELALRSFLEQWMQNLKKRDFIPIGEIHKESYNLNEFWVMKVRTKEENIVLEYNSLGIKDFVVSFVSVYKNKKGKEELDDILKDIIFY